MYGVGEKIYIYISIYVYRYIYISFYIATIKSSS